MAERKRNWTANGHTGTLPKGTAPQNPRTPTNDAATSGLSPRHHRPPFPHTHARTPRTARSRTQRGAITLEYALTYSAIILPLTMAIIFTAELLWIWNSTVNFTREGARYAATHCWQSGGTNVVSFMRANIPPMIDQQQFLSGSAQIDVLFYSRDPDSGSLVEFSCVGECSTTCIPDVVQVSVRNYEFRYFLSYLGLPPVPIPDFQTTIPMESAGCDPEQGVCLP